MAGPTTDEPTDGRPVAENRTRMQLTDTTQLGLERALAGAAARQQAIANNLANVNTPGYRRQDVAFEDALKAAFGSGDRSEVQRVGIETITDPRAAMRVDGSSTDVDTEAAAEAKNGLYYNAIASVLKARNAIIRSSLGLG